MARAGELLVGLDIGTTKICAVIGEVTEDGVDIIGIGTHPSKGLRRGVVINIDSTVSSINRAIEEAELMAGCEVSTVYAGIAGGHIKGFNSNGIVAIRNKEVTESDIAKVIEAARTVAIPADREVLHVLPREYIIDDQAGITEPIGMSGVRFEAKVHIVTGSISSAQNILKCTSRCNLQCADVVLEQLASSAAVLSADEKELGCVVIDIGGGTTDIAVWHNGTIIHTSVLSLGGNHITKDIAVGLYTPMAEAERIKQRSGCASTEDVGASEMVEVPGVGGRRPRVIPRLRLAEIIEPRVEEIFALVRRNLAEANTLDKVASGAIITGGTTILSGMPAFAAKILHMPVRRGLPRGVGGLVDVVKSPKYSTAVGLVLYAMDNPDKNFLKHRDLSLFQRTKKRLAQWLSEAF